MDARNSRVLVDLAFGAIPYAGIPIESRLMYKALSLCPELHLSGMIYSLGYSDLALRAHPGADLAERTAHQAQTLQRMLDPQQGNAPPGMSRLQKVKRLARMAWRILFRPWARLEPLESGSHSEQIWKHWLSHTLPAEDAHLAELPMYLCDISRQLLQWRCLYHRPGPRLDTRHFDFALVHEARPLRVSRNTCKVVRYYDAIPVVRPDMFLGSDAVEVHSRGLRACRADSILTCISEGCREELLHFYPELRERAVTIPCTLAAGYYPDRRPDLLPRIVTSHTLDAAAPHPTAVLDRIQQTGKVPPYLMLVSTIEPRKNHLALMEALERVLAARETDLSLVFVGSLGWNFDAILQRMAPLIRAGRLFHLHHVPQDELRVLYSHADCVVFPSFIEGFGYSPLEAMCCGTPVIASDIPVHRGVYGEAAEYCDPYRSETLARAIERVCFPGTSPIRSELIQRGLRRVYRYQIRGVSAQWRALLAELRRQRITHNVQDARLNDFNQELRRIERSQEDLFQPTWRAA